MSATTSDEHYSNRLVGLQHTDSVHFESALSHTNRFHQIVNWIDLFVKRLTKKLVNMGLDIWICVVCVGGVMWVGVGVFVCVGWGRGRHAIHLL